MNPEERELQNALLQTLAHVLGNYAGKNEVAFGLKNPADKEYSAVYIYTEYNGKAISACIYPGEIHVATIEEAKNV